MYSADIENRAEEIWDAIAQYVDDTMDKYEDTTVQYFFDDPYYKKDTINILCDHIQKLTQG